MQSTTTNISGGDVDSLDDDPEEAQLHGARRITRGQSRIEFEQLAQFFHVPINEAAKGLGVCATVLKKVCRKHGIPRWPHRKIKKLDTMLSMLEAAATKNPNNPQHEEEIRRKIDCLMRERMVLMTEGKGVDSGSPDKADQKKLSLSSSAPERPKKRKRDEADSNSLTYPLLPPPRGAPLVHLSPNLSSHRINGDSASIPLASNDSMVPHTFPSIQGMGFGMGFNQFGQGMILNSMVGMGVDLQSHTSFLSAPHSSLLHQAPYKQYRHYEENLPLSGELPPVGPGDGGGHGFMLNSSRVDNVFSSDVVQHSETHFRLLGVDIPLQSAHNC